MDVRRLDSGGLELEGRGRDVLVDGSGDTTVLAAASLHAVTDADGVFVEVAARPEDPGLDGLLGTVLGGGYRSRVAALLEEGPSRTLIGLLLDDLAGASVVVGYDRLYAAGGRPDPERPGPSRMIKVDICAGWVDGGTMVSAIGAEGSPPVPIGPEVPDGGIDATVWHEMPSLVPGAVRRLRRLDVDPGDPADIDLWFRDCHVRGDHSIGAVHEYSVRATIDPLSGTIASIDAVPRVLPWPECPRAAASARDLLGLGLDEIGPRVVRDLRGLRTCTHLNDALRQLGDVSTLPWRIESIEAALEEHRTAVPSDRTAESGAAR